MIPKEMGNSASSRVVEEADGNTNEHSFALNQKTSIKDNPKPHSITEKPLKVDGSEQECLSVSKNASPLPTVTSATERSNYDPLLNKSNAFVLGKHPHIAWEQRKPQLSSSWLLKEVADYPVENPNAITCSSCWKAAACYYYESKSRWGKKMTWHGCLDCQVRILILLPKVFLFLTSIVSNMNNRDISLVDKKGPEAKKSFIF